MSLYQDIANALESWLQIMPPVISVAWENVVFEPTSGTPYMRVSHLPYPKETIGLGIDGYERVRGIMQISLFYPKGYGRKDLLDKADELVQHFEKGTALTAGGNRVLIEQAYRVPEVPEADWYHVPVEVRWTT